jgi:hypothetical protein
MDYQSYMKRIQSVLEKIKVADKTGRIGNKGDYQLGLDKWPPTRILSLMLALSAWVGWVMHEKYGSITEQPFS